MAFVPSSTSERQVPVQSSPQPIEQPVLVQSNSSNSPPLYPQLNQFGVQLEEQPLVYFAPQPQVQVFGGMSVNGGSSGVVQAPLVFIPQPVMVSQPFVPPVQNQFRLEDVVFTWCNGWVSAIHKINSKVIWKVHIKQGLPAQLLSCRGKLFVACSGTLHAVDQFTGKVSWVNNLKGFGYGFINLATTTSDNSISSTSPFFYN